MKIDLNKSVKDLDGVEIPDGHMGKIIANMLTQSIRGDALKYWGWALKLNNKEELEIDQSDFETLKEFVKNHEQLTILTKAQVLEILTKSNLD